jgi:hypothetical protein
VIFGVAVGCFGLYHLYLACKNRFARRPLLVLPSIPSG